MQRITLHEAQRYGLERLSNSCNDLRVLRQRKNRVHLVREQCPCTIPPPLPLDSLLPARPHHPASKLPSELPSTFANFLFCFMLCPFFRRLFLPRYSFSPTSYLNLAPTPAASFADMRRDSLSSQAICDLILAERATRDPPPRLKDILTYFDTLSPSIQSQFLKMRAASVNFPLTSAHRGYSSRPSQYHRQATYSMSSPGDLSSNRKRHAALVYIAGSKKSRRAGHHAECRGRRPSPKEPDPVSLPEASDSGAFSGLGNHLSPLPDLPGSLEVTLPDDEADQGETFYAVVGLPAHTQLPSLTIRFRHHR